MVGLLKSQMCVGRGQKWGIKEGFELDVEGTAEIGEMARGAVGVLECGEKGEGRDIQKTLGGGNG